MHSISAASAALLGFALAATASPAQQTPTLTPAENTSVQPSTVPTEQAVATAPSPATANTVSAASYSKIRIVRLSEVKGKVEMDRTTGRGFETAVTNLPIIEGGRLQTEVGVAEVEFEDNSTLRLTPGSLVEFPRLELLPTGAKASTVKVLKGTVYATLAPTKGNDFTILFGQQRLQMRPSSHIRLQMTPAGANIAVIEGTAQVQGPAGITEVGKNKTALFPAASGNEPVVAKNVASEQFDQWDKQSAEYHKRYTSMSALGNSPYAYGASDLAYYGSFTNAGGCGSMWRPYFASAAWSPYDNGAWAWYGGAGYSWVSPYPWGWTPYHTGSWGYCDGTGWGWQPGGAWNGLANSPSQVTSLAHRTPIRFPKAPVGPPITGRSTLLRVDAKPLVASNLNSPESFIFRNDSAGLGIPRGSLGKLDHFSGQAAQHGSVAAPVYAAASGASRAAGPGAMQASGSSATSAGSGSTGRQGTMTGSAASTASMGVPGGRVGEGMSGAASGGAHSSAGGSAGHR